MSVKDWRKLKKDLDSVCQLLPRLREKILSDADLIATLERELAETRERTCEWTPGIIWWATGCGQSGYCWFGSDQHARPYYCLHCGGKIIFQPVPEQPKRLPVAEFPDLVDRKLHKDLPGGRSVKASRRVGSPTEEEFFPDEPDVHREEKK